MEVSEDLKATKSEPVQSTTDMKTEEVKHSLSSGTEEPVQSTEAST